MGIVTVWFVNSNFLVLYSLEFTTTTFYPSLWA